MTRQRAFSINAADSLTWLEAEDNLVEYLKTLPGETRTLVAANAANRLLYQWECERREMIQRDDPCEVLLASSAQIAELHAKLDRIILATKAPPNPAAERRAIELLEQLPPDAAAWAAFKVVKHEEAWAAMRLLT